ncbi:hypothetical protein BB560_002055 [Smittium megazygosporum]|uniref:Uncharacterized protein n=1 Tax=Smittium megazygosporum TaxID=133381 RepID=A0A2T9ZFU7_9FUNG|nr:hypothetical protein BB560_002055 [Smittium megazygosporum]
MNIQNTLSTSPLNNSCSWADDYDFEEDIPEKPKDQEKYSEPNQQSSLNKMRFNDLDSKPLGAASHNKNSRALPYNNNSRNDFSPYQKPDYSNSNRSRQQRDDPSRESPGFQPRFEEPTMEPQHSERRPVVKTQFLSRIVENNEFHNKRISNQRETQKPHLPSMQHSHEQAKDQNYTVKSVYPQNNFHNFRNVDNFRSQNHPKNKNYFGQKGNSQNNSKYNFKYDPNYKAKYAPEFVSKYDSKSNTDATNKDKVESNSTRAFPQQQKAQQSQLEENSDMISQLTFNIRGLSINPAKDKHTKPTLESPQIAKNALKQNTDTNSRSNSNTPVNRNTKPLSAQSDVFIPKNKINQWEDEWNTLYSAENPRNSKNVSQKNQSRKTNNFGSGISIKGCSTVKNPNIAPALEEKSKLADPELNSGEQNESIKNKEKETLNSKNKRINKQTGGKKESEDKEPSSLKIDSIGKVIQTQYSTIPPIENNSRGTPVPKSRQNRNPKKINQSQDNKTEISNTNLQSKTNSEEVPQNSNGSSHQKRLSPPKDNGRHLFTLMVPISSKQTEPLEIHEHDDVKEQKPAFADYYPDYVFASCD